MKSSKSEINKELDAIAATLGYVVVNSYTNELDWIGTKEECKGYIADRIQISRLTDKPFNPDYCTINSLVGMNKTKVRSILKQYLQVYSLIIKDLQPEDIINEQY